ncbi:unnamed protein product [Calicophoron daubneyi]|uniref:Uncharacterized protein n=1 Tax=Calicophoron daubneyi TaxID=300641 RepID=A0AAV2T815_CALDB
MLPRQIDPGEMGPTLRRSESASPAYTPRGSERSTVGERSQSAPPDIRVNDNYEELLDVFRNYYTSLPISLTVEESPVIMKDLYKRLKAMPSKLIAPDGYIPNSLMRTVLKPHTPMPRPSEPSATDMASQRVHLEQLIKRYLSDERTKDTLSSITFLKDVALLRIATSGAGADRMRSEIMTNLAIEVEGLLEQPCEIILEEDQVEEDEAQRMEKSAKLHKFARQVTKQAVQKHFEHKVKESLERLGQKGGEESSSEESIIGEEREEDHLAEHSGSRSIRTPTGWRQEEDLIDRLEKQDSTEVQKRIQMEKERTLPYEFVKTTLERMSAEWGGMARVMGVIYGAVKKKQSTLDQLDSFLKSREARVGMINSVVSPSWAFLYLSNMLGTERTLMEQLEALVDPDSSQELISSLKSQLVGFLGSTQRLDKFAGDFANCRKILENILVQRGMPKDAAKNLVYEALCGNADATQRIGAWISMPDPTEAIHAVRICNSDRLNAIASALPPGKRTELPAGLSELDFGEKSKDSIDASLLQQLDSDAKRVMLYEGPEEVEEEGKSQVTVHVVHAPEAERKAQVTRESTVSSSEVSGSFRDSTLDLQRFADFPEALYRVDQEATEEEGVVEPESFRMGKSVKSVESGETLRQQADYEKYMRAEMKAAYGTRKKRKEVQKPKEIPVRRARKQFAEAIKLGEKEPFEDFTEAPESVKSFEEASESETSEEFEELDIEAMEKDIVIDEEPDELARALETGGPFAEPEVIMTKDESGREVREVYPDPAFLEGRVKRFVADTNNLDALISLEEVLCDLREADEYLHYLTSLKWFTTKNVQLKKENIAVELMRLMPRIQKHEDLREAEIALILLRRQYGLHKNCASFIVKQASKLFYKYLNLLRLARKTGHSSKNDAFVRALGMLSLEINYGEDVSMELEELEIEFRKPPSPVREKVRKSPAGKGKKGRKATKGRRRREEEEEGEMPAAKRRSGKEAEEGEGEVDKYRNLIRGGEESEAEEGEEARKEAERARRREELAAKLRAKTQERQAMDRVMARKREKISTSGSSESRESSARGSSEEAEASEDLEREKATKDRLDRRKKALRERDTETSSSHERDIARMEEEISVANLEARRRRARELEAAKEELAPSPSKKTEQKKFRAKKREAEEGEPTELEGEEIPPKQLLKPGAVQLESESSSEPTLEETEEQAKLIKIPLDKVTSVREAINRNLRDFLEEQSRISGAQMSPSVSLRTLGAALQDPTQAARAEELIEILEKELGIPEEQPGILLEKLKDQLDSTPSGKTQPFNKMVNLLSVLMTLDTEEPLEAMEAAAAHDRTVTSLQPEEVDKQRQNLLLALVDDITSQLKYEYSVLTELSPGQRGVWMTLETQADTTRECCEKISFLIQSKAMTPELASFVTSVFTMNLHDCISMLKKDSQITEDEQRIVYKQARDMMDVLNWFGLKPEGIMNTLEEYSYLGDEQTRLEGPQVPSQPYQLDMILPDSYMKLIGTDFFADFQTVNFVPDDTRVPLDDLYEDGSMRRTEEEGEHPSRKHKKGSRTLMKLMTQRLSEIKKTFEEPARKMDPHSALARIGRLVMAGVRKLQEERESEGQPTSVELEDEQKAQIFAYETGKIPITSKAFATANTLGLRRKTFPVQRRRRKVSEQGKKASVFVDKTTEHVTKPKEEVLPAVHGQTMRQFAQAGARSVLTLLPGVSPKPFFEKDMLAIQESGGLGMVAKAGPGIYTGLAQKVTPFRSEPPKGPQVKKITLAGERKRMIQRRHYALVIKPPTVEKKGKKAAKKPLRDMIPLTPPVTPFAARGMEPEEPTIFSLKTLTPQKEYTEGFTIPEDEAQPEGEDVAYRIVSSPYGPMLRPIVRPATGKGMKQVAISQQETIMMAEQGRITPITDLTEPTSPIGVRIARPPVEGPEGAPGSKTSDKAQFKPTGVWSWLDQILSVRERDAVIPGATPKTALGKPTKGRVPKLVLNLLEQKVTRITHLVKDVEGTEAITKTPDALEAQLAEVRAEIERRSSTQTKRPHFGQSLLSSLLPGIGKSRLSKPPAGEGFKPELPDRKKGQAAQILRSTSTATPVEKLPQGLDLATHYLQSVVPPGRLTRLLDNIRSDHVTPDALASLEKALIEAALKAQEAQEGSETDHIRGAPRPGVIRPDEWYKLGLRPEMSRVKRDFFRTVHKSIHCRYALLALRGYHKQDLSIAAHLARMDLMEFINKTIQQRAYRRIQKSMMDCLNKVMQ